MADSRRSARLQELRQKTPHPPHVRRSPRLEFPGVSYERQIERKTVFPLMSLPRELRNMIYSKALELGFEDLLGVSKQVREEARPYLWKSRFFVLGKEGVLIDHTQDPQREAFLYPRFPYDIRRLDLALHDRVVNKLALIQNLALEIDFLKFRSARDPDGPPMLRQSSALDRHLAAISGVRLPTLGPPVGLLEPFLSPQSGSNRRNTCEITLKNFICYDQASVNMVLEVLIRLNKFKNIFVAFESPEVPKPGQHGGDIRRRFNACKKTLEAGLGRAIWHDEEGGYLAFHPSG